MNFAWPSSFNATETFETLKGLVNTETALDAVKSTVGEYWQIAAGTVAVVGLTAYAFSFRKRHLAEQAKRQAQAKAPDEHKNDPSLSEGEEQEQDLKTGNTVTRDGGEVVVHTDKTQPPPVVNMQNLKTLEDASSSSDQVSSGNDAEYQSGSEHEEKMGVPRRQQPKRKAKKQ